MSEERDTFLRPSSYESEGDELDQNQRPTENGDPGQSVDTEGVICLSALHKAKCEALEISPAMVSPEDLLRSTLTDEPVQQLALLHGLFKTCGIYDPFFKSEREHLLRAIACDAPNSLSERDLLYYSHAATSLAMRSAGRAHGGGPLAAEAARNFVDLATFQLRVRDRFDSQRAYQTHSEALPVHSPKLLEDGRGGEKPGASIVQTPSLQPPQKEGE